MKKLILASLPALGTRIFLPAESYAQQYVTYFTAPSQYVYSNSPVYYYP
jgi:hypothetical protein